MELKLYAGMILKQWRLIAVTFIATALLTAFFVNRQPWVYEASTTYVIRPSPAFNEAADDFVRAMDTLSRHTDINATFSQVAGSRSVRLRAFERLGLSDNDRKGVQVSGAAIAGSNILEISVRGPRPGIVRDMANAVGLETTSFMSTLYDVFVLEQLDEATLPSRPASPNKLLTLAVGSVLGLMLGVGLVFLRQYLQEPDTVEHSFNIIDAETGAYNREYFFLRLGQEISRAQHSEHIFSVALIKLKSRRVATGVTRTISGHIAAPILLKTIAPALRKEDVLARLEDDLFALLLPAMPTEAANSLMGSLEEQVRKYISGHTFIHNYRILQSGAVTDVAAAAVTYTSTHLHHNADTLVETLVDELGTKESSQQRPIEDSSEDATNLIFLPGMSRSRDTGRAKSRRDGGKDSR